MFLRFKRGEERLDLDDVFADALNLSDMDKQSLEGRLNKQIAHWQIWLLIFVVFAIILIFASRLFYLQITHGEKYKYISDNNSIELTPVFAKRGVIKDRFGRTLAENSPMPESKEKDENDNIFLRQYNKKYNLSLAHVLGYIKYPQKDKSGKYWRENYEGVSGLEEYFNDFLNGRAGKKLTEKDALGNVVAHSFVSAPQDGGNLQISIDAELNKMLFDALSSYIEKTSFKSGASVIVDVQSGEVLAMTSYPSYDNNKFALQDAKYIQSKLNDKNKSLLNRALGGVYTPGSIIKPFVALAALKENIISPEKKILSKGALVLPNPYNPDKPTIFKDWKAHGWVNMKEAIAHSSDEYFYVVGGGYMDQKGLGIKRILKYMKLFGFGEKSGIELSHELPGLVPSPKWKEEVIGEKWHIGNTYHTSIGQYSFTMTVLQAARAVASVADGEFLRTPTLVLGKKTSKLSLDFDEEDINIIHDGMRMATNIGTARPLKIPGIQIAGKTGTAQTGKNNETKNSWIIGFWPYKNPKFAFATMLNEGSESEHGSASHAMMNFFKEMIEKYPEYAKGKYPNPDIEKEKETAQAKILDGKKGDSEEVPEGRGI